MMARHTAAEYWAFVRRGVRMFGQGFVYLGASNSGCDPREALAAWRPATLDEPPDAHPERIVPEPLLSDDERRLWSQLF